MCNGRGTSVGPEWRIKSPSDLFSIQTCNSSHSPCCWVWNRRTRGTARTSNFRWGDSRCSAPRVWPRKGGNPSRFHILIVLWKSNSCVYTRLLSLKALRFAAYSNIYPQQILSRILNLKLTFSVFAFLVGNLDLQGLEGRSAILAREILLLLHLESTTQFSHFLPAPPLHLVHGFAVAPALVSRVTRFNDFVTRPSGIWTKKRW